MKKGPRWYHKAHAKKLGYFWLPCPVCGEEFGGHEWEFGISIPNLSSGWGSGKGVCSRECMDRWYTEEYEAAKKVNPSGLGLNVSPAAPASGHIYGSGGGLYQYNAGGWIPVTGVSSTTVRSLLSTMTASKQTITYPNSAHRTDWSKIPVRQQEDAIKAQKLAQLYEDPDNPDKLLFLAMNSGLTYGVEERARCNTGITHLDGCPSLACTCGFYAMDRAETDSPSFSRWGGVVILEVELSGRIIRGNRNGYRAGHQRVMKVGVPKRLVCAGRYWAAHECEGAVAFRRRLSGSVNARCEFDCDLPALSLSDLSSMLGTEVEYVDI